MSSSTAPATSPRRGFRRLILSAHISKWRLCKEHSQGLTLAEDLARDQKLRYFDAEIGVGPPGTEDVDRVKGEIATFLRYAIVLLAQTKSMTAQKIGLLNGKMMCVAVLESESQET